MKKTVLLALILISIASILISLGANTLETAFGLQQKAGLKIESKPQTTVYIGGLEYGKTPFQQENFSEGEYLVELKTEQNTSWQRYVHLQGGTLTILNREIEGNEASSSGELITLEEGKGVTIISTPSLTNVSIDDKDYGQTPITILNLDPGEHRFTLSHPNYLKRSIRAVLPKGFNLNLTVNLAISAADLSNIVIPPTSSSKEIVVLKTPTGFLRVRKEPNISSLEVARVKPGDILTLIEEIPFWKKVRLPDGKEGYVFSAYVKEKK